LLISLIQLLPQECELLEERDDLVGKQSAYFTGLALVDSNAMPDRRGLQIALLSFLILSQAFNLFVQVLDLVFVLFQRDQIARSILFLFDLLFFFNGHEAGLGIVFWLRELRRQVHA
jgi:hypothetical protein